MLPETSQDTPLAQVQIVRTQGFRVSKANGKFVKQLDYDYLETYNENGTNAERICRRADESLLYRSVFRYDSERRVVEELLYATEGLPWRTLYSYRSDGRVAEKVAFDTQGCLREKKSYSYDVYGGRTDEITLKYLPHLGLSYEIGLEGIHLSFRLPDMDECRVKSVFNCQGKPVDVIVYSPVGTEKQRVSYAYDDNVKLTRISRKYPGSFISRIRMAIMALLSPSTSFSETFYQYDVAGRLVELRDYMVGFLQSRRLYDYDFQGNRIQSAMFSSSGRLIERETYEYEYDSYGNWTKEITKRLVPYFSSEQTFVRRRTISYWDFPAVVMNLENRPVQNQNAEDSKKALQPTPTEFLQGWSNELPVRLNRCRGRRPAGREIA